MSETGYKMMQTCYNMYKYQDITSAIKPREKTRRWCWTVLKDTIKYKERQDLSKVDETMEQMRINCQGENKKKLTCRCFYERRPENIEKLKRIQKLNTILTKVTRIWNKTIIIA